MTMRILLLAAFCGVAAFPADYSGKDPYPDNLELPVLSLPGGEKATKRN